MPLNHQYQIADISKRMDKAINLERLFKSKFLFPKPKEFVYLYITTYYNLGVKILIPYKGW